MNITDFGLTVTYSDYRANVHLPTTYKSNVCGLCGDWDDDEDNDVPTPSDWFIDDGRDLE